MALYSVVQTLYVVILISAVHSDTGRYRALNNKVNSLRDLLQQDIELLQMDMLGIKPDILEEVRRLVNDVVTETGRAAPGDGRLVQGGLETCRQQIAQEQDARRRLEERVEQLATLTVVSTTPDPNVQDTRNRLRHCEHKVNSLTKAFADLKMETIKQSDNMGLLSVDVNQVESEFELLKSELAASKERIPESWGSWQAWGTCSVTCGEGQRQRVRQCPVEGSCLGSATETESCDTTCASGCPVEVGDRVRVKTSVTEPKYGWGTVRHGDVGQVQLIDSDGDLRINFPNHSSWLAVTNDMEIVCD